MIIRRRTYIKLFTGQYGYFMRNVDAYNGSLYTANSSSGSLEYKTNIYTKCMLKETPIGNFPINYRNTLGVINSNTTDSSGYYRYIYSTNGYTDGSTIVVATSQNLYISNNGGASWTFVCKWWLDGKNLWRFFNPIVYMDSSNYYIIYATYGGYSGASVLLKRFVRSRSSTTSSTSTIQTISSSSSDTMANMYSTFYANKVSPKGLFMFLYLRSTSGSYATYKWMVVDIPRGTYAYYTLYNLCSDSSYWQYTGQWINDGTTYGLFFLQVSNIIYGENYHYEPYHVIITSSAFRNGSTLSGTLYNSTSSNTSKFGKMFSDNLVSYNNNLLYWPQFLVASCDLSYKNKIFVMVMLRGAPSEYKFYVCNADFSNPMEISGSASTIEQAVNPRLTNASACCGVYVTSDGQYGVMLRNYGAAVFDLVNNSYIQGFRYLNNDDDGDYTYMSVYTSFMLPNKTI